MIEECLSLIRAYDETVRITRTAYDAPKLSRFSNFQYKRK